jgi:hypothetical protein
VRGHRVVVSCENNAYMAWQAKLIHYSCVTHLDHVPIIVVHAYGQDWHPYFDDIRRAGGIVHPAPSYRFDKAGQQYPPRNTAGTLIHALEARQPVDEFFVLCDADMIFTGRPELPSALTGEHYGYMNFDQEWVRGGCQAFGLEMERVLASHEQLRCGVPHVVPVRDARRFGERWVAAIDAFPSRVHWTTSMYAFGMAAVSLGMRVETTRVLMMTHAPEATLSAPMVHYCYGDDVWAKVQFHASDRAHLVWDSRLPPGLDRPETVRGAVIQQIQRAREYYLARGSHTQLG